MFRVISQSDTRSTDHRVEQLKHKHVKRPLSILSEKEIENKSGCVELI